MFNNNEQRPVLIAPLKMNSDVESDTNNEINNSLLLESLENALFNEKSSPVILPPVCSLLESFVEAIQIQEKSLEPLEHTFSHINGYMDAIKKIELERIKYIARSYVEIRIEKITQQIYYLNPSKTEASLMSHEKIYLKNLRQASSLFLSSTLYSILPETMQKKMLSTDGDITDQGLISGSSPSLNCHITCYILENIGDYMIDPVLLLSVSCTKGDIYRMPFKAALELVLNGSARFI